MPDPIPRRFPAVADLEPSVLKRVAGARRLDALFKVTASDFLLREQFVTDPTQILSEYVDGANVSPESASVANHLLYAVMANPELRAWLNTYTSEHQGRFPPREQFLTDFGRAVARDGDEYVVFALLRSTLEKGGTAGFEAFESMVRSLGSIDRQRGGPAPIGAPPTGSPPAGGPPTGGPPTGGRRPATRRPAARCSRISPTTSSSRWTSSSGTRCTCATSAR